MRVPGSDAPYVAWSKPWSFHGAEVVCEFRIVRFRAGARGTGWPPAFTVFREPRVEGEGLVWSDGPTTALSGVGRVRYRWDVFIIDVRETRHCLFYERQLDHHERQHLLYAERLIRRLQEDGEDLVSRLLRKPVESAHEGRDEGRDGGSEVMRQGIIQRQVERFVAEHRALRNRYGTAAEEEARVARESIAVLESDIEDLEANCLARTSASDGE